MRLLFTRAVAPARREHYGDGNSGSRIGEETCEEQVAGDASALISRCESPRIEHSGQQGRPARGSVRTSRRLHRRTGAPTTPSPISPTHQPDRVGMDVVLRCVPLADRTEYAPSDVRAGNTTDHGTQPAGRTRQVPVAVGPGRLLKAHFESRRQPSAPMTR